MRTQRPFWRRDLERSQKNMSGISEGGGKPGELIKEIVNVAEALIAFDKAFETTPNAELIRRTLEKKVPKKE